MLFIGLVSPVNASKLDINSETYSNIENMIKSFVLYFNLYNSYTSFYTFSQSVKVGDLIVIDYTNDGSWDHMGFVTAKNSTSSSYVDQNNVARTYFNFQIAQHSNKYLLYVNSNSNNWETYSNTARYAIVTR
jgi:Putative amidase domain